MRDAIARADAGPQRSTRRADAVSAVTVSILHGFSRDEGLVLDRPPGEVGMSQIQSCVQHRHPDSTAAESRLEHPRRLQSPSRC